MSNSPSSDKRNYPRFPIAIKGWLELEYDNQQFNCDLNDISISALSVSTDMSPKVGEMITINFPGAGHLRARVARVSDGKLALRLENETNVQISDVEKLAQAIG